MTPPQPRAPAAAITVGTPGAGIATMTAIDRLRQGGQVGHALAAVDRLASGVDRPDRAREARCREVAQHRVPVGAGPLGGSDDRTPSAV